MLIKILLWTLVALNVAYIVFLALRKAKRTSSAKPVQQVEETPVELVEEEPAAIEPPIVVRTIQPKQKEEQEEEWWNQKIVLPKQNRTATRKQSKIDPDQQLLGDLEGDLFGN